MNLNNVVIAGRLTKDPELRYLQNGTPTARITVATNRPFTNQNGEREADFVPVVLWRKNAENVANYLKKGDEIGIVGRVQTGSYEGQDGKRVWTTDIVADNVQFGAKSSSNSQGGTNTPQPQQNANTGQYGGYNQQSGNPGQYNQQNYTRAEEDPFANSNGPIEVSEDDLPF